MKYHKNISGRIKDALRGIFIYFKEELKYYQYVPILFLFVISIYLIKPNFLESLFIILLVAISIFAGFFNMIIEKMCDLYSREYNPLIRDIKDLAAGATSFYVIICVAILTLLYIY